jgi:hypothetical protein
MTFDDGRVAKPGEAGRSDLARTRHPHELLNCSDWQYRNVLIEIKARASEIAAA